MRCIKSSYQPFLKPRCPTCFTFLSICLMLQPVNAAAVQELFKLIPSNSAAGDGFGLDVDVSGNTAIISARYDDVGGAAYLFDVTTGEELFRLTASDAFDGQLFGSSVAISDNLAIVGARNDNESGNRAGAAYVFDVRTGVELYKLVPEDPLTVNGDRQAMFGWSVDLDGHTAIVGTGFRKDAAYIFDVSTGEMLWSLAPSNPHPPSQGRPTTYFGTDVEISGDRAVVGAYAHSESAEFAGTLYVFDTATGEFVHQLFAPDPGPYQFFGEDLSMDGASLVASVNESGNIDRGRVFLFDVQSGREVSTVNMPPTDPDNYFAEYVAVSDNNVVLTAPHDTIDDKRFSGSAYLYSQSSEELFKFYPADGQPGDEFGTSAAIDGDVVLVSSVPQELTEPFDHAKPGAAYVFRIVETVLGDVNEDGMLDVRDIDDVALAIREGRGDPAFDVNSDGNVTLDDHRSLIKEVLNTWLGDANLDGEFNSGDLVEVFQANNYEDQLRLNSGWATGDWNADGEFTSSDLVAAFQDGGYERGPRVNVIAVPEPTSLLTLIVGSAALLLCRARRSRRGSLGSSKAKPGHTSWTVACLGLNTAVRPFDRKSRQNNRSAAYGWMAVIYLAFTSAAHCEIYRKLPAAIRRSFRERKESRPAGRATRSSRSRGREPNESRSYRCQPDGRQPQRGAP